MKYRKSFIDMVKRYERCNTAPSLRQVSEIGLHQFWEYESTGKKPEVKDSYFQFLLDGKAWWEWTLNSYKDMWPGEWPGWYMLAHDFMDDTVGFKQLRQRMRQVEYFRNINVSATPAEIVKGG